MTVIEVSFLTGRYSATSHHDRGLAEWPPHGARLFSAMVAAWADAEPPDSHESAALEWLEAQPPPRITASEAVSRRVVSHFVPVNDSCVVSSAQYQKRAREIEVLLAQWEDEIEASGGEVTKKAERLQDKIHTQRDVADLAGNVGKTNPASALGLLPEGRVKKERFFPSVTLMDPRVAYAWDDIAPPEVSDALARLLDRVTRLGHSSSLVSCRLRDDAPAATHVPGLGVTMLRWVQPGQLAALKEEHQRHQELRPRSLPFRGISYGEVVPREAASAMPVHPADTSGEWIVFELEPRHRRMPMTRTVELTRVLRDALLHHASDPLPEGLSGHLADGRPTAEPHVAFLALPNVGYKRSDGRVMGLAISLPDELDGAARRAAFRAVGAWERRSGSSPLRLTLGRSGVIEMRRRQGQFALVTLRPQLWSGQSQRWTSVTPVALPAHPGDLSRGSAAARAKAWARAEEALLRACQHVGLPIPADVQVSLTPFVNGARPAADYPVFKQGGGPHGGVVRRLVHVSLAFADLVRGPLMLGSGRFMGLGLMRPVEDTPDGEAGRTEVSGNE